MNTIRLMVKKAAYPTSMALTILIAMAIELVVGVFLKNKPIDPSDIRFHSYLRPPSVEESIVQWQITRLLQSTETPYTLLLLGDSSCLTGLAPKLMRDQTRMETLNLGTLGWLSMDGHADILELYLKNHSHPHLLIYEVSLYPLTASAKDIARTGYLKRFRDWQSLITMKHSCRLPSLRVRDFLTGWLVMHSPLGMFLSIPRGAFPSDNALRQILWNTNGFMPEPRVFNPSREPAPPFVLSKDFEPGFRRLLSLCKGSQVLVVLNPQPEIYESAQFIEQSKTAEHHIQEIMKDYPWSTCYTPFLRFYPNSFFATDTHLRGEGVVRNSREIASAVRRLLND